MSYLDKTFCASTNCKNDCGRRMTEEEHQRLIYLNDQMVSYGYFCEGPVTIEDDRLERFLQISTNLDNTVSFDLTNQSKDDE